MHRENRAGTRGWQHKVGGMHQINLADQAFDRQGQPQPLPENSQQTGGERKRHGTHMGIVGTELPQFSRIVIGWRETPGRIEEQIAKLIRQRNRGTQQFARVAANACALPDSSRIVNANNHTMPEILRFTRYAVAMQPEQLPDGSPIRLRQHRIFCIAPTIPPFVFLRVLRVLRGWPDCYRLEVRLVSDADVALQWYRHRRTVSNWEARWGDVWPLPNTAALSGNHLRALLWKFLIQRSYQ